MPRKQEQLLSDGAEDMCRLAGGEAGLQQRSGKHQKVLGGSKAETSSSHGSCQRLAGAASMCPRTRGRWHTMRWRTSLARQGKAASCSGAVRIGSCTRPGAPQGYVGCKERTGSCSLRQDLGKRVLGIFRNVLAQWACQKEGEVAAHPTLHPQQAELADSPMMLPCAKGPCSSRHPLPTGDNPRKENPEQAASFQVLQMASSVILIANCCQPTIPKSSKRRNQTWASRMSFCILLQVPAWI